MTLRYFVPRLGRLWAAGALGIVAAAYGCGGSSNTDQNEPPGGNAGHAAGAVGHAGSGAAGSGGTAAAGKGGSSGAGATSAGRGGSSGSGGDAAGRGGTAGKGGAGKGGAAGAGTAGGTAGTGEAGASSGAGGEGGAPVCDPNNTTLPFETRCLACAQNACGRCLCTDCGDKAETCQNTPGCADIAACVNASGCNSEACYCGQYGLAQCLAGQSDGPCKDVILNAPGGHAPSLQDPSAGPAEDAALAVGLCAVGSGPCAADCQ